MSELTPEQIKHGRPVPWVIAAFFISFVCITLFMARIAIENPPHLVTNQAYEKGLSYNQTLQKADKVAKDGLNLSANLQGTKLQITLTDAQKSDVSKATVWVYCVHPENGKNDYKIQAHYDLAAQGFIADSKDIKTGHWRIYISAVLDGREAQSQLDTEVG